MGLPLRCQCFGEDKALADLLKSHLNFVPGAAEGELKAQKNEVWEKQGKAYEACCGGLPVNY